MKETMEEHQGGVFETLMEILKMKLSLLMRGK